LKEGGSSAWVKIMRSSSQPLYEGPNLHPKNTGKKKHFATPKSTILHLMSPLSADPTSLEGNPIHPLEFFPG